MSEFEEFWRAKTPVDKEAAERIRAREREDLQWILADARGRRVIWKLLTVFCNVLSYVFHGDGLEDAWENGRRYVGILIQQEIVEVGGYRMLDIMAAEDKELKEREGG